MPEPEPDAEPLPDAEPVPDRDRDRAAGEPETARMAIVIDDAGYSYVDLAPFLEVGFPLTVAILPKLPYSEICAMRASEAGHEVIVHLPLEASDGRDPGPGTIYHGQDPEAIRSSLRRSLQTVPGYTGANNHMGSKAGEDLSTVRAVLREFARMSNDDFFFLDSRTSPDSVIPEAARELGIPALERHVFIDNNPDPDAMAENVRQGAQLALEQGHAVLIGHVQNPELATVLRDLYDELKEKGIEFVTTSQLVAGRSER